MLHYLSFAAIIAAFAFVTLSLASGLLYVSELIEEHARAAKAIGQKGIYAIITLHAVLYFTDALPLPHTVFSIFCHFVYLQNFSAHWPFISLTSLSFVASCVLVVVDHFLWFFHFARVSQEARHTAYRSSKPAPGFADIATFFGVCVWLAPLFLFLSLSAGDNALPTTDNATASPSPNAPPRIAAIAPMSLAKSLFSTIPFLPRKLDKSEGIIAPRTPTIPPPSPSFPRAPSMPASPVPRRATLPPPPMSPRTPGGQIARDFSGSTLLSPDFKLATPPQRHQPTGLGHGASPAVRGGITRDGEGLGLRLTKRSNSSNTAGRGYE
ncbi:DUF396-domain-containing protein [Athelia psychrophila]|uniref:DUF396-domain-containing protein n=1 Tax=Athelia psychrophila TaxID=1759441 RepID=A0A165WMM2_9AGAM|nr:DUF396-domain-containing protein [Fibularhizoctonia sp. CBS 109695]